MEKKKLTTEEEVVASSQLKRNLKSYTEVKKEYESARRRKNELVLMLKDIKRPKYWDDYSEKLMPNKIKLEISIVNAELAFAEETMNVLEGQIENIKEICGEEGYELIKAKYIDKRSGADTALVTYNSKRAVYTKLAFYIHHVVNNERIVAGDSPWQTR